MKLTILLLLLSGCMISLVAQENILPHFPTPAEEKAMPQYLRDKNANALRGTPIAPSGNVRTMAEWEQIQALIITWAGQTTILREIVRNAVKECKVLIITENEANVTSQLTNAGIALDSVQFVNTPFNSIWVRDYGPWTVYQNDVDSLFLIDWIYNRPRAEDDATPLAIASHLNVPIFEATVAPDDWVHTGGNHLPDGMGTAFSSMLVLNENTDKTESQIDAIAQKFLGVNQYIKFPTLPYDGIHHLDMHMRILDEETIIFGEYPEGVADGPQINSNIEYLLENFQTAFGNKYKIVRMPMPPENGQYPDQGGDYRTYTNSIFINKTILVPVYEEKYDTTALRIYRENLPGYNVVGINCNSIIPSLGALHCITKLVGVNQPLLIAHARLRDSFDESKDYLVNAIIKHQSGIEEASVFYRIAGDSIYAKLPMVLTDTALSTWEAVIPQHTAGSELQYYIHAIASNGKEQVRPIVAPEGYFNFRIHGEPVNQFPVVSISSPLEGTVFDIETQDAIIEISADDSDGSIASVVVYVNNDSITTLDSAPFTHLWTFPSEGDYTISAKAIDDKGAATFSDIINIVVESTTSIDGGVFVRNVYPNPVEDILWIKSINAVSEISVTDVIGQKLLLGRIPGDAAIGVDFMGLPSGIYFVEWKEGEEIRSTKVIKR